ncbi:TonB C-terminal domain-containing protein [Novosphingobium aquimarinum]|uniref:TonB C-terminal domain-containing protein n=1 Tax=Novosphingobium aquimarinum TaxID=2682494 RepID=UPI0012ECB933|nr:TonB C-terminal domain-containing protein [Novosphingobium aquimarinum]
MAAATLRREEGLGLAVAIAAHIALVAVLLLRPESAEIVKPPERIEVTISDEVALRSTSPTPYAQPAPDIAPTLGEAAPMAVPDFAEPLPLPPQPVAQPEPRPAPPADERPRRRPEPSRSETRPTPRRAPPPPKPPAPPQRTERRQAAKPAPAPAAPKANRKPATKSAPARATPKADPKPTAKSGGSRVGADFLEGVNSSEGSSRSRPAAEIGPRVQASLASAITRQLKPHWQAPQGADADQLVTIVRFRLNRDGSLSGSPTIVRQSGVTSANEAQKERHAEQAIRAVRLAAPFNLPEEFYDGWKTVTSQFDRRLSQ